MLLRLVLFLLIFATPVALSTLWFMDHPGSVQVDWLGWQVETSIPVLLLVLLALFLAQAGLVRLAALLADLPTRLGQSRRLKDREKGMKALLAALDAAHAGDVGTGRQQAADAARFLGSSGLAARLDRLMPRPPVPSPASGDSTPVKLGRRLGLMARLAMMAPSRRQPAAKLSPTLPPEMPPPPPPPPVVAPVVSLDEEPFFTLVRAADWEGALVWIDQAITADGLASAPAARFRALVLLAKGQAEDALLADPGFLPAARQRIARDLAAGRTAEAEATLGEFWQKRPAAPLLAAAAGLWDGLDGAGRLARIESLIKTQPNHLESHLAAGAAAVAAGQWGLARRHLVAALKITPDLRAIRLMAEVEEKENGDAAAVAIWQRKEADAQPAPIWHCGACGAEAPDWAAVCAGCGAVGSIDWGARGSAENAKRGMNHEESF
ncbi:MAG TPA: hypothetical protein HPP80_05970 [Rhodospirillaceae bacterium]|nr:hypothetical protein [Rhodospirillaceae bacterium]